MSCVRKTLLVTNLLMAILVLGLLLIAGGVWLIVDEEIARLQAHLARIFEGFFESFSDTTKLDESVKEIPNEVVTHSYFNYALLVMGAITFLVAFGRLAFGRGPAKKESTCLLTTYSICLMLIIVLSVTAIVLINVQDPVDKLIAAYKFRQSLFFSVAAALSTLVLIMSFLLCCREKRVQEYVETTKA